jgi:hypothetical protein
VDTRILNQLALFSLMSTPTATLDDWLRKHPGLWRRVVVPARLKWEIRDKLDQANINERIIFPGLDGISRWLTRYYTPTGAQRALPKRNRSTIERPWTLPAGGAVQSRPKRSAGRTRKKR